MEPAGEASGNTSRSRAVPLPGPYAAILTEYATALGRSPPADSPKTKYTSRLRGYLAWPADQHEAGALDSDPLTDPVAVTGAVRDFRRHPKNSRRAPNTIDTYLSAIDDFYTRRDLGKPQARREGDTRRYALPTEADKEAALGALITDHRPEQQTGSERVTRLSLPYPSLIGGRRVRAAVGECGGWPPTAFDAG